MSTVKISELASLNNIGANTSNTLVVGVDLATGTTGKFTVTKLSETIYANNVLNVGNNAVLFPGVVGQFASNNEAYLQVNLQNKHANGSGDYVVTADTGTDTTHYVDVGINGSNYNFGGEQPFRALDSYLIAVGGANTADPGGNLMIGTLTQTKDIEIVQGGAEDSNVVAAFIYNTGFKLRQKPLIFADGSTQNTSTEGASQYANAAYDAANVVFTKANNAYAKANAAFDVTNTAVQNTATITLNGNLVVPGMLSVNNSTFGSNTQAVAITGSAGFARQYPANDGYMLHVTGKDGVPNRIVIDSFGAGNTYSLFTGRSGRGTAAAPTSTQANDVIARYSSSSYGGTQGFLPLGVGRMDFVATENHSDTNRGTQIQFWSVNNGSNTLTQTATLTGSVANFPGTITANNLIVSGNVIAQNFIGNTAFVNATFTNVGANAIIANNITANVITTGNTTLNSDITTNSITLNDGGVYRYNVATGNATVTQLTDKTTAVTANGRTGQITTAATSLAKGAAVTFTVNNSYITSNTDVPVVAFQSGATTNSYAVSVTRVQTGSFNITITNNGAGPLSDTIIINFAIIRVS